MEAGSSEERRGSYLFGVLQQTLQNNIDFFACTCQDEFTQNFIEMLSAVEDLETLSLKITAKASAFDYDSNIPANGYRSYCIIVDRYVSTTLDICRQIVEKRESMFFRAGKYAKDIEARVRAAKEIRKAGAILLQMVENADEGTLFLGDKMNFKSLLQAYNTFDMVPFYGRCLGMTMCESLQNCLTGVSIAMATFSDQFKNDSNYVASVAATLFNSTKYTMDVDERAAKNMAIVKNVSVEFVKSFWTLNELSITKRIPGWMCPSLAVCERVTIPLEALKLDRLERVGEALDVPYPSSHIPTQPVQARLFSHERRQGQSILLGAPAESVYEYPPTSTMLLHLHGGGFIAQSPDSHEIYLREWAAQLQMPILSIDYSLAPQAPFPRALEEVFYAYAWLLNNPGSVGWSGEKIVVGGDSGGGNLSIALALKCIHLGVRRPDALFAAYTPLNLQLSPSPSRLLCAMDSLIPLEFLLHCLHSYTGVGMHSSSDGSGSPTKVNEQELSEITVTAENKEKNANQEGTHPDDVKFENVIGSYLGAQAIQEASAKIYQDHFAKTVEMFLGNSTSWSCLPWFNLEHPDADATFKTINELAASPFISPLLADDQMLSKLPPTYLLALHLDPTLDDMVQFARRLRKLNRTCELMVLDKLPHGFLNFLPFSKEAAEGSKVACDMIRDAFAFVPANPINPMENVPL